jgi:Flp pilus assembly protein TadG
MRIHRDERGQTIILVALSLPLLIGFIGIATDVGALFKDKRTLQTAADAAAIAGALNLNTPNSGSIVDTANIIVAARAAAAANGFTDGVNGVTVTVPATPQWPASNYNGKTGYVEVTITKPESTIFLALFGYPTVNVLARAVAANGPGGGIMYALGTTGTTLSVTTALNVLGGGGIVVDSADDTNAMKVTGSVNAASTGIVGGCSTCSSNVTPRAVSGIIPYSDPLSFLTQVAPGGSCTNTLNSTGGTVVLFPGCYATFNETGANVTLNPGTYVINTGVNAAQLTGGTVSGTGVTFFINSGNVLISGTTMNISAPIGGNLNGILFQQSSLDTSDTTIAASPNSNLQGFFYFPNNALLLNGSFGTLYAGFVAKSISITSPSFTFNNYASLPGVNSPITSAVLVE